MSYTNGLDKPTDYFNTVLYTGNGSTGHAITGVGFQPDLVWLKCRPQARNHRWIDVIRGVGKHLESDNTDAEESPADGLTAFGSDGFTVGNTGGYNNSSENFVAWNWLAGGSASSNTDGTITSTVSANQTAGFSIVSYTGTNNNQTVGHGLGAAPKVIILKNLNTTNNWCVGHGSLGFTKHLALNETDAVGTSSVRFQDTAPTSTVYSVGAAGETNGSGNSIIAYCFAEKKGFSKFGSYTGNGQNDNAFIYTGFKPAFIMIKKTDSSDGNDNWVMVDNKRLGYNVDNNPLYPNTSGTEVTSDYIDFLSNGAKIRNGANEVGRSGVVYIYMAFAESPFVTSTGIPTTAR